MDRKKQYWFTCRWYGKQHYFSTIKEAAAEIAKQYGEGEIAIWGDDKIVKFGRASDTKVI